MKYKLIIGLVFMALFTGCSNAEQIEIEGSLDVNITNLIHNGSTLLVEDYLFAIGAGEVNGAQIWNKFGYNDDIDPVSSPEIIASWGGTAEDIFLSSAELLNISSTDINDNSTGTGAHSIVITGINNNWVEIVDIVTLDGTNNVQSNLEFLGVNRMAIYQSGSHLANWGDITATASSSNEIQGQIPAESGTSQQSLFFVEANHTFLMTDLVVNANKLSGGSTPKITILGYTQVPLSTSRYEVFRYTLDTSVTEEFIFQPRTPFIIGEEQILYFTGTTDTQNTLVNVRFSGILKESD